MMTVTTNPNRRTVEYYTEPHIAPGVGTPWPQTVEIRLAELERIVGELSVMHGSLFPDHHCKNLVDEVAYLRQQIADLRVSNSALIEALLKTDGDEDDDTDF